MSDSIMFEDAESRYLLNLDNHFPLRGTDRRRNHGAQAIENDALMESGSNKRQATYNN
jgi:hypothetical protein